MMIMITLSVLCDNDTWNNEDFNKIKNRDPEIFTKIYNKYKDKIFTYLLIKFKGNEAAAEEVLSDTFHSALESAHKLKHTEKIIGWLLKIAFRRYSDYLRKKYREDKYSPKIYEYKDYVEEDNDDLLIRREKVLVLYQALDNLDKECRKVLRLMYIEKKTRKEIAKIIKKDLIDVQNILYKARNLLKKEVNKIHRDFI